jgi:O-antigen/teichoic acid export membrane protein
MRRGRAAAQIGLLGIDTLIRAGVGLVVGTLVAIQLGPIEFGALTYGLSIVGILVPLISLGLDAVLIQRLGPVAAGGPEEAALIGTALRLRMIAGVIVAALIAMVALGQAPAERSVLLALAPAAAGGVLDVAYPWVIVRGKAGPLIAFRLAFLAATTAARITALVLGLPLAVFALLASADLIIPGLSAWLTARRSPAWHPRYDQALRPDLLQSGVPLLVSGLLLLLMFRIDVLFVDEILGGAAVGVYGAVIRLSEAAYLLPNLVVPTMTARIVAASPLGSTEYFQRYGRLMLGLVGASLGIAGVTALLAAPLMSIYRTAYTSGAPVLAVHIFALVPLSIAAVRERLLVDARLTRASALNTLGGLILKIALNLVLLPKMGLVAAAWATVGAYATAALFIPLLDPRQRRLFVGMWRSLAAHWRAGGLKAAPPPDA